MSLVRDTSWSAAASIISAVTRLAIAGILARKLDPELFGSFVFVQWLVDMTFLVFSLGLAGVGTRFLPATVGDASNQIRGFRIWYFNATILVTLLTGVLATIVVF